MFRTAADELREEGMKIGRDEGRVEGLREGALHAKAGTLMHLLSRRFGPLAARAEQRIRQANEAQLEHASTQTTRLLETRPPG